MVTAMGTKLDDQITTEPEPFQLTADKEGAAFVLALVAAVGLGLAIYGAMVMLLEVLL